jgi:hypothetical protein
LDVDCRWWQPQTLASFLEIVTRGAVKPAETMPEKIAIAFVRMLAAFEAENVGSSG